MFMSCVCVCVYMCVWVCGCVGVWVCGCVYTKFSDVLINISSHPHCFPKAIEDTRSPRLFGVDLKIVGVASMMALAVLVSPSWQFVHVAFLIL